jgi:hypothetical protein
MAAILPVSGATVNIDFVVKSKDVVYDVVV